MQVIHHSASVFSMHGLLSADECRHLIDTAEQAGFDAAGVQTGNDTRILPQIRNNDRLVFDDTALAHLLWQRCRAHCPLQLDGRTAQGLYPHFRFYRYEPGQRFKMHKDGRIRLSDSTESRLTLLIYLNQEFTGGATVFKEFSIQPQTGTGLFFIHEEWHEGALLTAGSKYALRTDVLYGPA